MYGRRWWRLERRKSEQFREAATATAFSQRCPQRRQSLAHGRFVPFFVYSISTITFYICSVIKKKQREKKTKTAMSNVSYARSRFCLTITMLSCFSRHRMDVRWDYQRFFPADSSCTHCSFKHIQPCQNKDRVLFDIALYTRWRRDTWHLYRWSAV